jgi:hypothetical protein
MLILRPTRRLHALLPPSAATADKSDTALGDWYVNRLLDDRRPLLILVSSRSLLPMLIPARDVRALPYRLPGIVAERLRRLGVCAQLVAVEAAAMAPVIIAPTMDRSVLGIMVDFAKAVPFYLGAGRWDERTLRFVESRLAQTPCHASRPLEDVIFPEEKALELLVTMHAG